MGVLDFPHPPLAAGRLASRLLLRHSPHEISEAIEVLVDLLDLLGGDPDAEEDDPAGQCDEDGVNTALALACGGGPGCLISDPDMAVDDQACDDINQDLEEETAL